MIGFDARDKICHKTTLVIEAATPPAGAATLNLTFH